MKLANRLDVPAATEALLLDLDGVVVDSLQLDIELVPDLFARKWPLSDRRITEGMIRRLFAVPVPEFWRQLTAAAAVRATDDELLDIIRLHEDARDSATFSVLPGIREMLDAAIAEGLKTCVVSNNQSSAVRTIIGRLELGNGCLAIVGLDDVGGVGKPDPALYREAAVRCGVKTSRCVAVEDSVVGLTSASSAGCFTIGVATGSTSFSELEASGLARSVYSSFTPPTITLTGNDPRRKSIATPNEFVTHMIEHILWRMGTGADLAWPNNDWERLGETLGTALLPKIGPNEQAAVIGMIDDGSCETTVQRGTPGGLVIGSAFGVDLDWFLSVACEQVRSGEPLVQLLRGLAQGTQLTLSTKVCSFEDPHHTWEGLFRSVGICLRGLAGDTSTANGGQPRKGPDALGAGTTPSVESDPLSNDYGWSFSGLTPYGGSASRATAESVVSVTLEMSDRPGCRAAFDVSDTIDVAEFQDLLDALAQEAGMFIDVEFAASVLSSSHVVTEDVGLALGKLLIRIAQLRWATVGMNGAGSSVQIVDDFQSAARVALSIEGRKYWKFVSLHSSFDSLRRGLLVGHVVGSTIRSEDLDDFIDGLSGGLGASVIVHVDDFSDPTETWYAIFGGLGRSLRRAFAAEQFRIGLPPGVKATLV